MEILGWLFCLVIAMAGLCSTVIAVMFGAGFGGKVGYEWVLPFIVGGVAWYFVITAAPFSIAFN